LNDLKEEHKKAEIGFWLLKEHWGKGYISEALPEICKFGFEKRKLHRIEAIVEQENSNSKKCLIKNNFILEGTMKECEIKNGRYISLEIYAKLNV
jgi:ribosomal-protein-alanine N-acetyltransferase